MRRIMLLATLALVATGLTVLPAAGRASPVVIDARTGVPATMPTHPGPRGRALPEGLCGATVGRSVWALPCGDPRSVATAAAQARRRQDRRDLGAVVLALAAATGGMCAETMTRRRGRVPGHGR